MHRRQERASEGATERERKDVLRLQRLLFEKSFQVAVVEGRVGGREREKRRRRAKEREGARESCPDSLVSASSKENVIRSSIHVIKCSFS